jgi:hypothetical protein
VLLPYEDEGIRPGCARWPCGVTVGFWIVAAIVAWIKVKGC